MKSVIKSYSRQNSSVYTCSLNAAKAFDRVSHSTLFSDMIKRNVYLWLLFELLHFGIKRSLCVFEGANLIKYILKFKMAYAKVGYCHQNYLLYMLVIFHMK